MKRVFALFLLLMMAFPLKVSFAATTSNVSEFHYYISSRNEIRIDYWAYPSNVNGLHLHFKSLAGQIYDKDYGSDALTGSFYLTCNGTYDLHLTVNGLTAASIIGIETMEISNGACESYPDNYKKDDLNVTLTGSSMPYGLHWTPAPGATKYVLLLDGKNELEFDEGSEVYVNKNGSWILRAFNKYGQVIGESDFQVRDGLLNPGGTLPPSDPGSGGGGSGSDISLKECADLICQCIRELKPALDQINQNTEGLLNEVTNQIIPKMDEQLSLSRDIKDLLGQLLDEFQTDQTYNVKPITGYPGIKLEDNKPPMRDGVYQDSTTYFTDQGDEEAPPAFPPAPEPVTEWKDVNGNLIQKQQPGERQPVMTKDPAMTKDPVMTKDPAMTKQPSQSRQPVLSPTEQMTRQQPLQQDRTEYERRWKQMNGVIE